MPGVEKLGLLGKHSSTIEILVQPVTTIVEEVVRPEGYAIQGLACFRVAVEGNGISSEGWGTGSYDLAPVKALSEAIERYAMFSQVSKSSSISSSNGWAAHTDYQSAKLRAVAELIERDTALRTWFDAGPYYLLKDAVWPSALVKWSNSISGKGIEFSIPTVLLSEALFGACISVLLQTDDGRTVVGHASGVDLSSSIESAFFEALRSAHASLRFEDFAEATDLHSDDSPSVNYGPGANGMAYAYGAPMPQLKIEQINETETHAKWLRHQQQLEVLSTEAAFETYVVGDRYVVRAIVNGMQNIFWGRTPKHLNVKNNFPHFVG